MTISINTDSLGSILGAVVSITYSVYFFINYIVVERNRIKLSLSAFVFTMFIFLLGFAVYSSSLSVRICHNPSVLIRRMLLVYIAIAIVLIFLPGDHFFTGELNPSRSHNTVIKGAFFPYFLISIFLVDTILMTYFLRGLISLKGRPEMKIISPLVFSFAFLLVEAIFNGVFGAILGIIDVRLAVSPLVMIFCLALYSTRYTQMKNRELLSMKDENRRIVSLLINDQLSGLYSRRYFQEFMEQRVSLLNRERIQDCLMYLDVDNFKSVNDELGHQKGDDLIAMMGEVIQGQSRASDICARYGGDEFLMLLENCSSEDALKLAAKIQREFARRVETMFREWPGRSKLSMSIGIISSDNWLKSVKKTIELADRTMYHSKKSGKNRISRFTGEAPL